MKDKFMRIRILTKNKKARSEKIKRANLLKYNFFLVYHQKLGSYWFNNHKNLFMDKNVNTCSSIISISRCDPIHHSSLPLFKTSSKEIIQKKHDSTNLLHLAIS